MVKKFTVTYKNAGGYTLTDSVTAWDFVIQDHGVLVFTDRARTRAYRDWFTVKEEK